MDIASDIRQRLDRVQAAMAAADLGGLLACSSGQHNMLRMDQMMYLTDLRSLGPAAVLVPRHGAPTLIVSPAWDRARASEAVGVGRVVAVDEAQFASAVAREAHNLDAPVGLAGLDVLPWELAEALLAGFDPGPAPVMVESLIPGLAASRTPVELERVTRAAEIADLGWAALCEAARVGMREYELAAELEVAMQTAGAEDNFGLLAAGAHNQAIRLPGERRLEAGDIIVAEITPCFRGHHAQLCRTLVLGEPTAVVREKFELLVEACRRGFRTATIGNSIGDVARAANDVFRNVGYADYCKPPYMRTRGHGLGFGAVTPNDVNEDVALPIQKDMVFIIHPNQYLPETGYMMLGDTVAIDDDGAHRLTRTPLRLFSTAN